VESDPKHVISRDSFLRIGAGVVATAFGTTSNAIGARADIATPVRLALRKSKRNGAVPRNMLGFSFEKSKLSTGFFSATDSTLNGTFKRLGPGILRLGGNAVDKTAWNPTGQGSTKGEISPHDVRALSAFIRDTGWQVIYGINLAHNTPEVAASEARAAASALGSSLYGFEIGNECDQYSHNGLRPSTYGLADFITEWNAYAEAIRKAVPGAVLTGPSSAGYIEQWTQPFAKSQATQIKLLTQHFYRAYGGKPTSTMAMLLADPKYLPHQLRLLQASVESNAIPDGYRLDEANTFFSGGRPNVSNAYGTALWAIDFLLVNSQFGSSGANFHGGANGGYVPSYTPLADNDLSVTGVRPLYYGMLFAAQLPPGPMFDVDISSSINVSAYGVEAQDSSTHLVIVNKDSASTAEVSVELGASGTRAQSLLLTGPSVDAFTGMTLGGAIIGNDGAWTPSSAPPIGIEAGRFTVYLAPASALLLKIT
jgi:hypothetical protein